MAAKAAVQEVIVSPVALYTIIDSFERRNEETNRVIGTLMGANDKGRVEVKTCFCVPHHESQDEVAVELDYAKNMYELHRKAHPTQEIVGWFATGGIVSEHSVLIHDYYSRECSNPIHMTMDTKLTDTRMGLKAYVSAPMGIPEKTTVGTIFTPVPLKVEVQDAEKVAVEWLQSTKSTPKQGIPLLTDLQHVASSTERMKEMLSVVMGYVSDVMEGRIAPDNKVGRFLMELVNSVPQVSESEFEGMVNNNMQDLLMIMYLSSLVKTQLAIGEKLNVIS